MLGLLIHLELQHASNLSMVALVYHHLQPLVIVVRPLAASSTAALEVSIRLEPLHASKRSKDAHVYPPPQLLGTVEPSNLAKTMAAMEPS